MRVAVYVTSLAAAALVNSFVLGDEIATYQAEIGYTSLVARLAAESQPLPTGAGVRVMQVEAPIGGTMYLPNTTSGELVGESITAKNGAGGGPSSHATTVGRNFYGNTSSIAPNISSVDAYNANDYLTGSYLKAVDPQGPVLEATPPKIQNHSWVAYGFTAGGGFTGAQISADVLRRLDYVVERDRVVSVVAVSNVTTMPQALAASYNTIAVGMNDATSSVGPTTIDVPGRSKPDIVAPGKFPSSTESASYAAPKVSAAAALLVETGTSMTSASDALQPETIKALLLTGATKDSLPSWSHTDTQPLDLRYGAGLLNIDNSHRILTADQQEASNASLVASTGWDYDAFVADETKQYFFEIGDGDQLDQLTITANWLRHIELTPEAGLLGSALLDPSLANIDLRLYEATGFTPGAKLAESVSTIDNVEHIFSQNLPAGRYMIELTSDQAWSYALAWDAQISAVPEPSAWILWSIGIGTLAGVRRWGRARG